MPADDDSLLFLRAPRSVRRAAIRAFHKQLQDQVSGGARFTVLVADDQELRRLNRQFLDQDYPTDVLSFPSRDGEHIGEIAISVERARDQAAERGHSLDVEISILMLHGALHLMGMDHEKDRGRMARAETRWRKHLGLPTGLIERTRP
jgi:probable rRNA maturation factor